MKNILISLLLFYFSCTSSYGQKVRYKDIKNDISIRENFSQVSKKKYSPTLAGAITTLSPLVIGVSGIGHVYVGEPLRGLMFLGGRAVSIGLIAVGVENAFGSISQNSILYLPKNIGAYLVVVGVASVIGLYIWEIIDVVKIARVKNIAYRDQDISFKIRPKVQRVDGAFSTLSPKIYGLGFSLNF